MVNEDLIAQVQTLFQRGYKIIEIKKELIKAGWAEKEIDDAISYIHREAFKQVPLISAVLNFWERFEAKVATMSPRVAVAFLIGLSLVIALIGIGLFVLLDPLNTKSGSRDAQRTADLQKIQSALGQYFTQNQMYPPALSQLSPQFLANVPKDPRTGNEYDYKLSNDNYELCIAFEIKPVNCYSGSSETVGNPGENQMIDKGNPSEVYTIDGSVFMDKNNDKVQQSGEGPPASVTAHVADSEGNSVCLRATDAAGVFSCNVPKPGVYYVFLDPTPNLEILGVNPQKITVPAEGSSAKIVQVTIRTAPIQTNTAPTAQ